MVNAGMSFLKGSLKLLRHLVLKKKKRLKVIFVLAFVENLDLKLKFASCCLNFSKKLLIEKKCEVKHVAQSI